MGSGTLCKTDDSKRILFSNDCVLFIFIFNTAPRFFRSWGYRTQEFDQISDGSVVGAVCETTM